MNFLLSSFASSVCCASEIEAVSTSNTPANAAEMPIVFSDRMSPSFQTANSRIEPSTGLMDLAER
jgi:hypothetical protein